MTFPDLYPLFVGTCVVLGLIPGPNIALIVANSIAHGTRYGLASVAGTSSAMVPQLIITILGATTLLTWVASAFEWLKWLGVAYLLYLGITHWFAKTDEDLGAEADKQAKAYRTVYWNGFGVSSTNPKTLMFFGAFLPQFISSSGSAVFQMCLLSITFLTIISVMDSGWAILAGKARPFMSKFTKLRNRVSGTFFMIAGAGLALARKP